MELAEEHLLGTLAYLQGLLGLLNLVVLPRVGSPYGRCTSARFGRPIPARVAWIVQELPALAAPLCECARASAQRLRSWPNGVLLAMFFVHYVQRSLIFPFLIRGGKPMPLYSCVAAFLFCTYNGYLQSRFLSQYAVYSDDWVTDPRFLTGFVLWLVGMLINIHSDHILRNLRKPGETGYKIPRGGFFEYVSSANYFGEVVEWCGFALASWSVQGAAFALFTFCFLVSRAKHHHQWYLEKFEDYPKFRKILIPFLF
ncbi:PREDICTED: 3-oxo-5-alpha-steroid 4-dehydrogenase 1 [Galeopterus variegatus]|uniref:3-oxo-5alpha-steroid 4-dehydrogenase (NADP(+)) n=1 Tax=Galeopterus variegatus TaxID=482537 RepID=A0ABM0S6R5_GALVR|nr:PREDICTED: 3-oxo-5-alpha-steroid 4-dehydrogenase 1 [Galeopterus variegatus]